MNKNKNFQQGNTKSRNELKTKIALEIWNYR